MRIAIVHEGVDESAAADSRDTLVQVEVVAAALRSLGHTAEPIALGASPRETAERIAHEGFGLVFNLVESLRQQDSHAMQAPWEFERANLRYTGARFTSMFRLVEKPAAKESLVRSDLPTPKWLDPFSKELVPLASRPKFPARLIVKSAVDHASKGLTDACVIEASNMSDVRAAIKTRGKTDPNTRWFAEEFIEGREFNLSLLSRPGDRADDVEVLPPAEIDFSGFPSAKPKIVGYDAKWSPGTLEFEATPRRFDFPESDEALLERLCFLARECWFEFALTGYARVDFRVDGEGEAFIIEINTNPCLSPDAGFAAALERAGIPFVEAVRRIVEDGLLRDPASRAALSGLELFKS